MMENHSSKTTESNKRQSTKVNVKVCDLKEQNMKYSVPINIANPASIIRVIPKKVTVPYNSSLNTFIVNCSNNLQSKTSPSTSTSSATVDHEYVSKDEVESLINIIYFNEPEVTEGTIHILQEPTKMDESKNNLKRPIGIELTLLTLRTFFNAKLPIILEDNALEIQKKISKVHSENCCDICRNTLETILQKQEEILRYLKNPSLTRDMKFDLLPSMPFNDLNDFVDFDESLTNENVLDQLITKLQRLLVSIDKRSVSNILGSLMTNELCKKISWIGIKDTIAFQNTNMINHIIDIIQDHHGIDVDIIKSYIAEWLRRCSDRIAGEIRKNKKKAQQFGYDDT